MADPGGVLSGRWRFQERDGRGRTAFVVSGAAEPQGLRRWLGRAASSGFKSVTGAGPGRGAGALLGPGAILGPWPGLFPAGSAARAGPGGAESGAGPRAERGPGRPRRGLWGGVCRRRGLCKQ